MLDTPTSPSVIPPYPARPKKALNPLVALLKLRQNLLGIWHERAFEQFMIPVKLPNRRVYVVNGVDAIKRVFLDNHDNYDPKSPQMRKALTPLLGDGLFVLGFRQLAMGQFGLRAHCRQRSADPVRGLGNKILGPAERGAEPRHERIQSLDQRGQFFGRVGWHSAQVLRAAPRDRIGHPHDRTQGKVRRPEAEQGREQEKADADAGGRRGDAPRDRRQPQPRLRHRDYDGLTVRRRANGAHDGGGAHLVSAIDQGGKRRVAKGRCRVRQRQVRITRQRVTRRYDAVEYAVIADRS